MKNIFFIIFGPLIFCQNFQSKDSLKILAQSNLKSMDVFESKNGKLLPVRHYNYDKYKNEITIKNISDENQGWLRTIIRLNNNYEIKEEERIIEAMIISEKENRLEKKQLSMLTKYIYDKDVVQIMVYDSKGNLSTKRLNILDKKNRVIESVMLFSIPDDIIVSEIIKFKWNSAGTSYAYEKRQFSYPKYKITGHYEVNKYGDAKSFKGNLYINNTQEDASIVFDKKNKIFDLKGNLIKVYQVKNNVQSLIEERKITY